MGHRQVEQAALFYGRIPPGGNCPEPSRTGEADTGTKPKAGVRSNQDDR
jgi:hypothetical protein